MSLATVLGVAALRSADPGDLSAARGALGGVPCASLALGTAGLRVLGVGGVPFFSGVGLPLLFASAEPDLHSRNAKPQSDPGTTVYPYPHARPPKFTPPGTRRDKKKRKCTNGCNGYSLGL